MRTVANNIVDRLIDLGAVAPNHRNRCVNEVERIVEDDYIPGGSTAKTASNLRPASAGNRCGVRTGNDVQSGPFYCGEPATLMADTTDNGIVCTCEHHESALKQIVKEK